MRQGNTIFTRWNADEIEWIFIHLPTCSISYISTMKIGRCIACIQYQIENSCKRKAAHVRVCVCVCVCIIQKQQSIFGWTFSRSIFVYIKIMPCHTLKFMCLHKYVYTTLCLSVCACWYNIGSVDHQGRY
jgi:hypothetical protein